MSSLTKNTPLLNKIFDVSDKTLNSLFFFLSFYGEQFLNFSKQNSKIEWPTFKKINKNFSYYFKYNSFQTTSFRLRRRPFNFKFVSLTAILRHKNEVLRNRVHDRFLFLNTDKITTLFNFSYIYIYFFKIINLNTFFFKKKLITKKSFFFVFLSFKNKKIFLNLKSKKKKTIFSLSQGLFLKFFEKRKSMRKHKNMKLLMAKFLRKLLYSIKIKHLFFVVRNTPLHLIDFLYFLNAPTVHKYVNPVSGLLVEEENTAYPKFSAINFVFRKNIDFSKNKIKKKGRIKRKITRKLTMLNNLTD